MSGLIRNDAPSKEPVDRRPLAVGSFAATALPAQAAVSSASVVDLTATLRLDGADDNVTVSVAGGTERLDAANCSFGSWSTKPFAALVLGAADDCLVPAFAVRSAARRFGVEAQLLPAMAHIMMLEPDWRQVADWMLGWLEERNL